MDLIKSKLDENSILIKSSLKIREDNDGYYILSCIDTRKWYCVSKTFYETIWLCDGKNNIADIIRIMSKRYINVALKTLEEDVHSSLSSAKKLKIVIEGELKTC